MPLINPDGYEYTHLTVTCLTIKYIYNHAYFLFQNRLWRKNRVPTSVKECMGADLNRNYPYHWGGNVLNDSLKYKHILITKRSH